MKRVGIFGGGQLAMMLAEAAKNIDIQTRVFAPDQSCPAQLVADQYVQGAYEDLPAVLAFAQSCDVVTFEFENIPVQSLFHLLQHGHHVAPHPDVLQRIQDRLTEKLFLQEAGVTPAPFAQIDTLSDFKGAIAKTGLPAVLKTRHFGYDGKGQSWITSKSDIDTAYAAIGKKPAVLEAAISFVREVSMIGARGHDGKFVHYALSENHHVDGILRTSNLPAKSSASVAKEAVRQCQQIADALKYVGVLAVEFFETKDGQLLVNEIAPRVHNSGHWTREGADVNQFELHLRAITHMDFPMPKCAKVLCMQNLIGDEINQAKTFQDQGWVLSDYKKTDIRRGRKMGHVVRIG